MADPLAPFLHQLFSITFTVLIPLAILGGLLGVVVKSLERKVEKKARRTVRPKSTTRGVKR